MQKLRALKNKKGFTLIEIIVVLVILAILAAALIPTMMGYVGDARQKSQLATANAYLTAAQAVGAEMVGLHDYVVEENFDPDDTTNGARWESLTKEFPGKGKEFSAATPKVPGVKVALAGAAGKKTSIESITYTYNTDKWIKIEVGAGGNGTNLVTYENTPVTTP